MAELFGFEIKRKDQEKEDAKKVSFVAPESDDGLGYVVNAGGHFGQRRPVIGVHRRQLSRRSFGFCVGVH